MHPFIAFVIILSILIFIHELGHFLVAKKFGLKIEEFGFGYPPRIWGKKIGETIYSINWIPFGGFVRIYGEDYLEKSKDSSRAMYNKPKWVRFLITIAGVVCNFLLGIVCFSIIYSFSGIPTPVDYVLIDAVSPGSPAQLAGLAAGDKVTNIDGLEIKTTQDFIQAVKNKENQTVTLQIQPKNETAIENYQLVPRAEYPEGEGPLGVAISTVDFKFYPVWQMPFRGAWVGLQEAVAWGVTIVVGLFDMIKNLIGGVTPEVAGPIGIYQITVGVVKQGLFLTLQFVGVLSINLAILNLLPIPALDGGRILFILIETIIGKRVKPQIEQYIHMFGMALLLTFMLWVTFQDVGRLISQNVGWQNNLNSILDLVK